MLKNLFSKQLRCKHRHTEATHPKCFRDGKPIDSAERPEQKVLLFDIETSPITVFSWGVHQQYINPDAVQADWFILSWSAKWLYSPNVMYGVVTPPEAVSKDDSRIVKSLWELFNEADIIIGHNAKGFDIPKTNTRFLFHKLVPPKPYQVVDTLSTLRSKFGFTSNKLDYVNRMLGIDEKTPTSLSLWLDSMRGDVTALKNLVKYNMNDVEILEELYIRIRGWIPNHPNMGLYLEAESLVCPNCGSDSVVLSGEYMTQINSYEVFKCKECGANCRSTKATKRKKEILKAC